MRNVILFAIVVAAVCVMSFAQNGAPAQGRGAAPDLKTTPLAKFIGTWEGESRMSMPGMGEPQVAHTIEKAQWKLGGTAVMVEGLGTMKDPATGEMKVVHEALGLMRFDPKSKSMRFLAFKANEPMVESELEILENGDMRWFMEPRPGSKVRFTITLADDTWKEIGEFSPDGGQSWHEFLQMNLKRIAAE